MLRGVDISVHEDVDIVCLGIAYSEYGNTGTDQYR